MKRGIRTVFLSTLPIFFVVFFFLFSIALAESPLGEITGGGTVVNQQTGCEEGKLCNPIGSKTLSDFVDKITTAAVKIGVVIASLFIIYAGLKFVMARGNPTEIETAKKIFWYTIIGTAILLAANVLANVLMSTINNVVK